MAKDFGPSEEPHKVSVFEVIFVLLIIATIYILGGWLASQNPGAYKGCDSYESYVLRRWCHECQGD